MISHEYGAIFIHIQKTGGDAISTALGGSRADERKHWRARDLKIVTDPALWDDYFKFAFVRNPWARLVSWYAMIDGMRESGPLNAFQAAVMSRTKSFEDFLRNMDDEIVDSDGPKWIWRNQLDYITDSNGVLLVDFVGRFENLTQDFAEAGKRLSERPPELALVNPSKHTYYADYYTPDLVSLVAQRYARDIERFGYRFEWASPQATSRPSRAPVTQKPNILFIMADQFRADALCCVGGYASTPHLDALAKRGCLFANAYANSAECIPSRLSLATGLYPHQFGVTDNMECTLDPSYPNWMKAIEDAGYRTSLFGKTHLHAWAPDLRDRVGLLNRYGFQVVDETSGPRALRFLHCNLTALWEQHGVWQSYKDDQAERFATKPHLVRPSPLPLELYYDSYVGRVAREHLASLARGAPWFCCVSFGGPHEPWDTPEPYSSMYPAEGMPLPRLRIAAGEGSLLSKAYASGEYSPQFEPGDVAAMRANYAGGVSLIDGQIGQIISVVGQRGELENTVIAFTSDHGEMNGDYGLIYKANFLDPAIQIPLIVSGAGSGRVSTALVELMDVGATLTDYAGAAYPERAHGVSLRAAVEGDQFKGKGKAVSEFGGHVCVVDSDLKCELNGHFEPVLAFDREIDPDETLDVSRIEPLRESLAAKANWVRQFTADTPPERAVRFEP